MLLGRRSFDRIVVVSVQVAMNRDRTGAQAGDFVDPILVAMPVHHHLRFAAIVRGNRIRFLAAVFL